MYLFMKEELVSLHNYLTHKCCLRTLLLFIEIKPSLIRTRFIIVSDIALAALLCQCQCLRRKLYVSNLGNRKFNQRIENANTVKL